MRGNGLGHRVHGIRTHRVPAVDDQVGDHHRAPLRLDDPDLDVFRTAADLQQHGILLVRDREDLIPMGEDRDPRAVRIRHPDELDLA